jgi:hypothetical protein
MNTKVKIVVGIMCAAGAILVASQSLRSDLDARGTERSPCYTQAEVKLLMSSMNWTREETVAILDMACKFSKSRERK